jgi:hypothetical protein
VGFRLPTVVARIDAGVYGNGMPKTPHGDDSQPSAGINWLMDHHDEPGPEYWRDHVTRRTWAVVVHWADVDGCATAVGIDVRSFIGDSPLSSGLAEVNREVLHRLPVAAIIEGSLDRTSWLFLARDAVGEPGNAAKATSLVHGEDRLSARRGRPQAHDDEHYQNVARLYEQALLGGQSRRKPALYIAKQLQAEGKTVDSPAQVRKWVAEARKRGHLPPADLRQKIDQGRDG